MIEQIAILSLPFGFAIVIQILNTRVKNYSKNSISQIFYTFKITPDIERLSIDLASHTFFHLSYLFSMSMASISCIGISALSRKPLLAAIGAGIYVGLIVWWAMNWQELTPEKLRGGNGKYMKFWCWGTIFLLWIITIYGKL